MEGGHVKNNRNSKVLDLAQSGIVGMNLGGVIPPAQHIQRHVGHSGPQQFYTEHEVHGEC